MEPSVTSQQAPSQSIENEAFWKHHLESQRTSRLSRAKYCREHQLDYDRFGYWISKWSKQSSSSLVSVKLKQTNAVVQQATLCTLTLPTGHLLHIHGLDVLDHLLEKLA